MRRLDYYQRIFLAYLTRKKSQLTFWHGEPQLNEIFEPGKLGEYYMPFTAKADYSGYYDDKGIPMLDYHGAVGLQYNPIAIAQYGLGNYNLYCRTEEENRRLKFINVADWMIENLEETHYGTRVWYHHFDWEYFQTLKTPWYSALAQGQGISLLMRAFIETKEDKYLLTANKAFEALIKDIKNGGVLFIDKNRNWWLEEYLVEPPSHVLNGLIWTLWGVYDYFLVTKEKKAFNLYENCLKTLIENLYRYDTGYWSLYDLSQIKIKNLASPFYHKLHIVQLEVLYRLSKIEIFKEFSQRWKRYLDFKFNRSRAYFNKAIFKLLYF